MEKWLDAQSSRSFAATTTAIAAAAFVAVGWVGLSSRKENPPKTLVPRVASWIPYFGCAAEYFKSVLLFVEKYNVKYDGRPFCAKIMGYDWYFINRGDDARKALSTPEKKLSFYKGIEVLIQGLLPTEEHEGKHFSESAKKSFFRDDENLPSTPFFIHCLKKLPEYLPLMQDGFLHNFQYYMKDSGKQDLFEWCWDLVVLATSRVMLGKEVGMDVVEEWAEMVKQCDLEGAFAKTSVIQRTQPVIETKIYGERRIYRETREFVYPYVEQEIEDHLAGKPEKPSILSGLVGSVSRRIKGREHPDLLRQARIRIANDLITFTFAALTNSYGAAGWSVYHIMKNTSKCGDKFHASVAKSKDASEVARVLNTTLLEISRLYTPGNVIRYTVAPFKLASNPGVVVPANSVVVLSLCHLHRRADLFADPFEFRPSRFEPEDPLCKENNKNVFGFGAGPHICVGRKFATAEVSIFVAEIFKYFDLELVEEIPKDVDPEAVEITRRMLPEYPDHPILDPTQMSSIWRPMHPVYLKYSRKSS